MSGAKRSQARPLRKAVTYLMPDEWDWIIKTKELKGVSVSNLLASCVKAMMDREEEEAATLQRIDNNQTEGLPW